MLIRIENEEDSAIDQCQSPDFESPQYYPPRKHSIYRAHKAIQEPTPFSFLDTSCTTSGILVP